MITYLEFIALVSAHIGEDYTPDMFRGFEDRGEGRYDFNLEGFHKVYTHHPFKGGMTWGHFHKFKGEGWGETLEQAINSLAKF